MVEADVIIIGAGASGLMCSISAGMKKKRVIILEHQKRPGKKILLSGGGRCNFTNIDISPLNYTSENPHFCKSALSRYSQWDFIDLVKKHKIAFEEREHGRLFTKDGADLILEMLMKESSNNGAEIITDTLINKISRESDDRFTIHASNGSYRCRSLVVATGGLAFPSAGATTFGYKIAEQFGINIISPRAGLVPLTLNPDYKKSLTPLSGTAIESSVTLKKAPKDVRKASCPTFRENILFTHRGISGPAILQISSYWSPGDLIEIDLLPERDLTDYLIDFKKRGGSETRKKVKTVLAEMLPNRLISALISEEVAERRVGEISDKTLSHISESIKKWILKPDGSEGYRTAEVTVGGVDCNSISSKTMEANSMKGLFFTGELLDVTGELGGYNLQWAWSSGWCAGLAA